MIELFRKNLRRIRLSKNLSQQDVSNRSGVTLRLVWSYEHKNMNPTLTTIERLAKALDVSVTELLSE